MRPLCVLYKELSSDKGACLFIIRHTLRSGLVTDRFVIDGYTHRVSMYRVESLIAFEDLAVACTCTPSFHTGLVWYSRDSDTSADELFSLL